MQKAYFMSFVMTSWWWLFQVRLVHWLITSLTHLYFIFWRNASLQGSNMIAIVVCRNFSCVLSYPFLHCWCLTCQKINCLSMSQLALPPKLYSLLTLWMRVGHSNNLLITDAHLLLKSSIVWSVTRNIFAIFATHTNHSGDIVAKLLIECIIVPQEYL